jgi:hypothetical protein
MHDIVIKKIIHLLAFDTKQALLYSSFYYFISFLNLHCVLFFWIIDLSYFVLANAFWIGPTTSSAAVSSGFTSPPIIISQALLRTILSASLSSLFL